MTFPTPLLFILGLIVGSFLNVLIYRIPRGQTFVSGRSRCPHCHHDLKGLDLVPVFSYLALRGRCRYCKHRISPQYPLIELISGALFVLAPSPFMIVVTELLLVLAVIDYQHLIIPDSLLIVLVIVAFAFQPAAFFSMNHLLTALGCAGSFFLLWAYSRGAWVGFGDVKLLAVLGLTFGFPGAVLVLYGAVLGGGLVSMVMLLLKKATLKTQLPFGTLLACSGIVWVLCQAPILALVSRVL